MQTVCLDGRPFTDPTELVRAVFALLPAAALDGVLLLDLARFSARARLDEAEVEYATPANGTPRR